MAVKSTRWYLLLVGLLTGGLGVFLGPLCWPRRVAHGEADRPGKAKPSAGSVPASEQKPRPPVLRRVGLQRRIPWNTSRIQGSPEPPLPYRTERLFPELTFQAPLDLTFAPGSKRLFVVERAAKIHSFVPDARVKRPDLFIDLKRAVRGLDKIPQCAGVGSAYGLAFHQQFARNRYCYICYTLRHKKRGQHLPHGTRVSRFTVTRTSPPRCDPDSEVVLLDWLEGGHNGGCLKFGPDGYLYISTGDGAGPHPPDPHNTGQDISDLLSSILRIDVNHRQGDKPYRIPRDNPFLNTPGARPEIWAYGFRNPWKMSFDPRTRELWVGDVGWEMWELVFRVKRAGNYGWSVMEGPQPVHPKGKRGPTPIRPPDVAIPHPEGASVTGGYVYRGKRFPELVGHYVYGDYQTLRLWANKVLPTEGSEGSGQGKKLGPRRLLALTNQRLVSFAEDPQGELLLLDFQGTIHRLVRNTPGKGTSPFPRKLSETGLFASVVRAEPAPGVVPFSINAHLWADHARARYLVALPGNSSIKGKQGQWQFPEGSVLAKTISLGMDSEKERRLETQILHFDGRLWRGYTYRWNQAQTDAFLVDAKGTQETFTIRGTDARGGKRVQSWRFPSRAECATCHNPRAGFTLAFNLPQLHKHHRYGNVLAPQLATLQHIDILPPIPQPVDDKRPGRKEAKGRIHPLVDPHDPDAPLDQRARSYLHVNCAHCHRRGGGGTALIDVQHHFDLRRTKLVTHPPSQGKFGIEDAQIIYPGDPYRSVLFYRMAKLGRGRMPHLGSHVVDQRGLTLLQQWIEELPRPDYLPAEKASTVKQRRQEARTLKRLRSARGTEGDRLLSQLLGTTSGALRLMRLLDTGELPDALRKRVLARATGKAPQAEIRDLFERFLPPEQRARRLGTAIDPVALLARAGDPARGRKVFFAAGGQCANCHRVGKEGRALGPDLTHIGSQRTPAQLLESILEPSRKIEPQYVTYRADTTRGLAYEGIVTEKTTEEVVLKDVQQKVIHLKRKQIERLTPQGKSLMPEFLLRDMTAQQAADLLAFLRSLK